MNFIIFAMPLLLTVLYWSKQYPKNGWLYKIKTCHLPGLLRLVFFLLYWFQAGSQSPRTMALINSALFCRQVYGKDCLSAVCEQHRTMWLLCKYLYLYGMRMLFFHSTAYFTLMSRGLRWRVTKGNFWGPLFQNCQDRFRFWFYLTVKWLCIALIVIPTTEILTGGIFLLLYLCVHKQQTKDKTH